MANGEATPQWSIICLAEGLKALGITFYSDRNFCNISDKEYLFNFNSDIKSDDCSIVILDGDWCNFGNPLPNELFKSNRKYITVFFELYSDAKNSWKTEFRKFDFIFRAHYNQRFKYPSNFHPWAYGIPNRVLKETQEIPDFESRATKLLVNFRIGHPLRNHIEEKFVPIIQKILPIDRSIDSFDNAPEGSYDYIQWVQTGKRHYPKYYHRLKNTIGCACFGGLLINPWPPDAFGPKSFADRIINKILLITDRRPRRLLNWDSMRLWESLAAGCVSFHVDLNKYGALLPEMPECWKHYIGIDLDNMKDTVDRIIAEPEILKKISNNGREWVLKNYSPMPVALRFLDTVIQ